MLLNVYVPSFKNIDVIVNVFFLNLSIITGTEFNIAQYLNIRILDVENIWDVLVVENKGWKYFHLELVLGIAFGQTMKFTNQWKLTVEQALCE